MTLSNTLTVADGGLGIATQGSKPVAVVGWHVLMRRRKAALGWSEVALLRDHGGRVLYHHSPEAILDPAAGRVTGLRARRGDGEVVTIAADVVVRATGQKGAGVLSVLPVQSQSGKVQVDAEGRTSHPRYWAGGDCVSGGKEVVNAVEEGKQAARSMARHIMDVRDGALAAQAQ